MHGIGGAVGIFIVSQHTHFAPASIIQLSTRYENMDNGSLCAAGNDNEFEYFFLMLQPCLCVCSLDLFRSAFRCNAISRGRRFEVRVGAELGDVERTRGLRSMRSAIVDDSNLSKPGWSHLRTGTTSRIKEAEGFYYAFICPRRSNIAKRFRNAQSMEIYTCPYSLTPSMKSLVHRKFPPLPCER